MSLESKFSPHSFLIETLNICETQLGTQALHDMISFLN